MNYNRNMALFNQRTFKRVFWLTIIILIVLSISIYWHYRKFHPSTDDAYVGANVVQVSSQVTGPILKIYINNFETVKKGQTLFDIDPSNFQVAYDHAKSQLDVAKQNFIALKNEVAASEANVQQRQSELKLAQQTNVRVQKLVEKKQLALAEGDKATRDLNVAIAALNEANNKLQQTIATLGNTNEKDNAQIRAAVAELARTKLNLNYTHVVSPVNGYVVNLTARVGTIVQANEPFFSIVDSTQWWVDANFKETELEYIRPLQLATLIVDLYPDHVFHGYVQQISRGSGTAFSIFPPENATGNWVKVTQRFPVRIYITDPDSHYPLRIGASSTVTVDTYHYQKVSLSDIKFRFIPASLPRKIEINNFVDKSTQF